MGVEVGLREIAWVDWVARGGLACGGPTGIPTLEMRPITLAPFHAAGQGAAGLRVGSAEGGGEMGGGRTAVGLGHAVDQRGAWGSGKVIGTLATDLRTNTRDVYDCIQFYFKCVDFDRSKLVEHVDHQHWVASLKGKPDALSWSWIRGKLPEGRAAPRRKVRRRTYTRQVQGYCNRRIGKEWTKANQQKIEHYLGYADDPDSIDPDAAVERGDKDEWT